MTRQSHARRNATSRPGVAEDVALEACVRIDARRGLSERINDNDVGPEILVLPDEPGDLLGVIQVDPIWPELEPLAEVVGLDTAIPAIGGHPRLAEEVYWPSHAT